MDKIKFACSGCNRGIVAPAEKAGKTARCPACGTAIQIPVAPGHHGAAPPTDLSQRVPQPPPIRNARDGAKTPPNSLDKITFACSGCGKSIVAPAAKAGKSGSCPSCGTSITIPIPAPPSTTENDNVEEPVPPVMVALDALANEDYSRAITLANEVLQTANTSPVEYGLALGIIGSAYKLTDHHAEGREYLENALSLFADQESLPGLVPVFADNLGDIYDGAIHGAVAGGDVQQAKMLCPKLADLIGRYKSFEGFNWVAHEGLLLLAEGMIAGQHEGNWAKAIPLMQRVLQSPYKEHFASGLRFVLGLANENIGRYYFLTAYRINEAIPYFDDALRYLDQGDEQYERVRLLLADAKSQAAGQAKISSLPNELRRKLDALRSGNDDSRLEILEQIPTDLRPDYFPAVQSAIMQAMCTGGNGVRFRGATILASMGDESYYPASLLMGNLTPPPSKDAGKVKCFALYGLSYVKGRKDVVERLVDVTRQDEDAMVRERALFALAATGNPIAKQIVSGLAAGGNDAAAFALEWATRDVSALRDAILNGREVVPGAALTTLARGWNGLPWGATLPEFQRRFPEAYIDDPCWLTGEGEERFERIRMPTTKYMFNAKGQFYLVAFYADDGVNLLDGEYSSHLLSIFGDPDGATGTSWSQWPVVLKGTQDCLVLVNTAFDDDSRSWEQWTGKPRPRGR